MLRFEAAAQDARLDVTDLERRYERACRALDEFVGAEPGSTQSVSGSWEESILTNLDKSLTLEALAKHPRQLAAERAACAADRAVRRADADRWTDLVVANRCGVAPRSGTFNFGPAGFCLGFCSSDQPFWSESQPLFLGVTKGANENFPYVSGVLAHYYDHARVMTKVGAAMTNLHTWPNQYEGGTSHSGYTAWEFTDGSMKGP